MLRGLFLVIFILLIPPVFAQENMPWAGFGIEANYIAGKAFKHTKKIRADFPDYSPTIDVNFVQQTYGRKDWQQRRRYPIVGMGIAYTNYDNDAVYGRCFSIYPNIRIPLIGGKKLEWSFKAGFGLGYITKVYERYPSWDTLNTAMSSRFNNYSYFATELRYRVNKHLDILTGINFSHVSNAALRNPNLGINRYGAHIGIRYSPVTSTPKRIVRTLPSLKNRVLFHIRLSMAATEMAAPDGPMYPIYMASAFASKRYWGKNKLLLGADYSFYTNVYKFLKNNEIGPGKEKDNSWKGSIFVGNEFLIGRVGILFQLGYYFKKDLLAEQSMYQKIGGNVYLVQSEKGPLKELSGHIYLKTHTNTAEFVEVGIGAGF